MPDKEVRDLWGVIFFGFPNALFRISTRFFSPIIVYIKQVRAVFAAAAGGRVHGAAEKSDGDGYRRGAAVASVSGEMPAGGGSGKAETWP